MLEERSVACRILIGMSQIRTTFIDLGTNIKICLRELRDEHVNETEQIAGLLFCIAMEIHFSSWNSFRTAD
jgi:hypothetical protein